MDEDFSFMKGISSESQVGRETSTSEKAAQCLGFKDVGVGGARMDATARRLPTALAGSACMSLPALGTAAASGTRTRDSRSGNCVWSSKQITY